jgi:hypothetical protein
LIFEGFIAPLVLPRTLYFFFHSPHSRFAITSGAGIPHFNKMNVNKKLGRFKQWAGERMGGEIKTNVSDDFKALEIEVGLRHEGRQYSKPTI